jgi:hypothetical protein
MWRTIDSAPKDGACVLVGSWRVERFGRPPVWRAALAWWEPEFRAEGWDDEKQDTVWVPAWTDGTVASWGHEECVELHPSHWWDFGSGAPLPEPPKEGK